MINYNVPISSIFASSNLTVELENFRQKCKNTLQQCFFSADLHEETSNVILILSLDVIDEATQATIDNIIVEFLAESLALLKLNIFEDINTLRDEYKSVRFVYDGKRWDCSLPSTMNIVGTILMSMVNSWQMPDGFMWRDYDNNNWPITSVMYMVGMGLALSTFVNECYKASWIHKYYIGILTTPAEVNAYDFKVGWPDRDI